MPVPEKILKAKQTPGKYLCKGSGGVFFIEVDAVGFVYQLRPASLSRDGLLSNEGWGDLPNTRNMQVFRLEQL